MIEILWPDGSVSKGATFDEVEKTLRISQHRPFNGKHDFRREMAARAHAWGGSKITTEGDSETFIQRLASTGLFLVVSTTKENTTK